jgi:hypothetical protein
MMKHVKLIFAIFVAVVVIGSVVALFTLPAPA